MVRVHHFQHLLSVHSDFPNALYNKPTRCTVYLHFIDFTTPLHVLGPFVVHHQKAASLYMANGICFPAKSSVGGPSGPFATYTLAAS
jgi:hypothetical protein